MSLIPHLGFFEIMLLAALALIVVGPKDLPRLMAGIGRIVAQMRNLANEFRAGFDQMAREAEMDEMRAEIENLKKMNPIDEIEQALDEAVAPIQAQAELRMQEDIVSKETPPAETSKGEGA